VSPIAAPKLQQDSANSNSFGSAFFLRENPMVKKDVQVVQESQEPEGFPEMDLENRSDPPESKDDEDDYSFE
jgi:hypothetical protein